jgi:hypothetical protein
LTVVILSIQLALTTLCNIIHISVKGRPAQNSMRYSCIFLSFTKPMNHTQCEKGSSSSWCLGSSDEHRLAETRWPYMGSRARVEVRGRRLQWFLYHAHPSICDTCDASYREEFVYTMSNNLIVNACDRRRGCLVRGRRLYSSRVPLRGSGELYKKSMSPP